MRLWVSEQFGICLQENQLSRIEKSLHQLKRLLNLSDDQLLSRLNDQNASVLNAVINIVTVQESYFFRDKSLFNLLRNDYLPSLIQAKIKNNDYSIRIWSAGCSRGEEIYSIAILLNELLPNTSKWHCTLIGTEICNWALEEATTAAYSSISMRIIDERIRTSYFIEKENKYYLQPPINTQVKFYYHNLAKNDYPSEKFDLIFCRNVFIYFSNKAIEHTLKQFNHCLAENGRLFLGSSEFLSYIQHPFQQKIERGVTYYSHITAKKEKALPIQTEVIKSYAVTQATASEEMQKIRTLLENKHAEKALLYIDQYITHHPETSLFCEYKARALSELGDIVTAREFCKKAIFLNNLNSNAYLLKGLIDLSLKNDVEAKEAFQNVLIIKKECVEAYYYLGKIALLENRTPIAISLLKQALQHAIQEEPTRVVFGTHKETLGDLILDIESEIKNLGEQK